MNPIARDRLFGWHQAFDQPITLILVGITLATLAIAPAVFFLLARFAKIQGALKAELWTRYFSWLVLVPCLLVPILLGAAWTIALVLILSLLCCSEYGRATGLFREKLISVLVVLGILAVNFAALDHWYRLFVALGPLTIALLAALPVFQDRPKGYIQRVALGGFGFMLFGSCLGHLSFVSNDTHYRPILIFILLAVELNDIFAFVIGKSLGKRKLAPNTSPNKTVAGAVGALVLTTLLVTGLGWFVFAGTALQSPWLLVLLGLIISITGQLSDQMVSSIKRDLGLKDMGVFPPGHGGLLDRFDSLILAAPAAFHLINYFVGIGLDQPTRILTGGG